MAKIKSHTLILVFALVILSYSQSKSQNIQNVFSCGGDHLLNLKSGQIFLVNTNSNIEDNRVTNLNFVSVDRLKDIKSISAGIHHSLAIDKDGKVWAWGKNNSGQLGIGSVLYKKDPIMIESLSDVVAISAGMYHSMALKRDGTVWAWGNNRYGQLGTKTESLIITIPIQIPTLNNIKSITCGYNHSLALKQDGSVWSWGLNDSGQLGDSTFISRSIPSKVKYISEVSSIVASVYSMALKNDGTVYTWGYNLHGQLGSGSTDVSNIPQLVSDLKNVRQIFCGHSHSLAITNDNKLYGWGSNIYDQLINTERAIVTRPQELMSTNGYQIETGAFYTMIYSIQTDKLELLGNVFYTINGNTREDYSLKNHNTKENLKIAEQ